jgi:sarcosine oxidase
MTYDVIVLGVGGMGSAVAYHAARRGLRVLALERFSLPHRKGSSHGLTRIIRLAYFEDPSYVPLLRRAYELWRDLEHEASTTLLHVTGGLDVGSEGSEVFRGALRSCEVHDLRHEVLTSHELMARFPAWQLPESAMGVFQPEAGFLAPEHCIEAQVRLAISSGAEVRVEEPVLEWEATANGVRVRTGEGEYEASQLVVSAGAWAGQLVPELRSQLVPERQVLGWFETHEPAKFAPERFPVFILDADEGRYYGFPVHAVPGFKIGKYHHLCERVNPNTIDRNVHPRDETALRNGVSHYFPSGNGALLRSEVCMFTNTSDEHFVIDRLPAHRQVLVVSPCSGHGFKFCSVVGEIVTDLLERDSTSHDISLFGLGRLLH